MTDMIDKLDGLYAKAAEELNKTGGTAAQARRDVALIDAWPGIARALRAAEEVGRLFSIEHGERDPGDPLGDAVNAMCAALDALKEVK